MNRRHFVSASLATGLGLALQDRPVQAQTVQAPTGPAAGTGPATSFDRKKLIAMAEDLGKKPYKAPAGKLPPSLKSIDYDTYRTLRYRPDKSLWAGQKLGFTAQFFHLGFLFKDKVTLYEVADGQAREIGYSPDLFNFGGPAPKGLDDPALGGLGFAGFRLHTPMNRPDYYDEVGAFLGASYFRLLGRGQRYGKSARGLAIDTAAPSGEEFPRFTAFWLERPKPGAKSITIHALLDSPATAGAYSFTIWPGTDTIADVDAVIFPRHPIGVLGMAPLTSMFFFGENDRARVDDFRPEVHDSDGLQLWTGAGEWIWRPLTNPQRLRVATFGDRSPKGFGLIQRDRAFASYEDLETRYDLRPSVWVEPRGDWGPGTVRLVEIPTNDETNDNIVAFWCPEKQVTGGSKLAFSYRLHWCAQAPFRPDAAQVVATRAGESGVPGQQNKAKGRKFAIEFEGGSLGSLSPNDPIEAMVTVQRGKAQPPIVEQMPRPGAWRTIFDVAADGPDPVELRCYLKFGDTALTETWSYLWTP
jgi:glucans biosynthesis protein